MKLRFIRFFMRWKGIRKVKVERLKVKVERLKVKVERLKVKVERLKVKVNYPEHFIQP